MRRTPYHHPPARRQRAFLHPPRKHPMTASPRTYNALRRIAGPCTAYRIARTLAKLRIDTLAIWTTCLVITLAVGAVAAQDDATPAPHQASQAQATPDHAIELAAR